MSEAQAAALSVVVPVYNAESFIAESLRELIGYLSASPRRAEIIVVDDGSSDATAQRARDTAATAPLPVRVVRSEANCGKGAAVRRGMQLAGGAQRVFLDADLAYPPDQIERVCRGLEAGADVVVASRVHPESRYVISPSFFRYLYTRHLAGRLFNAIVRLLLLPGIRDSQAGLKGFTASSARILFRDWTPAGFGFDLAILFGARRRGMRVVQIPVVYRYDSEATTVRFMLDTLLVLRDLAHIRARAVFGALRRRRRRRRRAAAAAAHPARNREAERRGAAPEHT